MLLPSRHSNSTYCLDQFVYTAKSGSLSTPSHQHSVVSQFRHFHNADTSIWQFDYSFDSKRRSDKSEIITIYSYLIHNGGICCAPWRISRTRAEGPRGGIANDTFRRLTRGELCCVVGECVRQVEGEEGEPECRGCLVRSWCRMQQLGSCTWLRRQSILRRPSSPCVHRVEGNRKATT